VLDSLAWNSIHFYAHWLALQKQVARARKANQLRAQVARTDGAALQKQRTQRQPRSAVVGAAQSGSTSHST